MVGNILGDADAIVIGIVESVLKGAENSYRARNGWTHKAEFSDDAMPLLLGHPALAGNRGTFRDPARKSSAYRPYTLPE